jgi:hypothetical protein
LEAYRQQWESHSDRRYAWPWAGIVAGIRRDEPSRFEVAVWSNDVLCGLAIGRTRMDYCRVDYLEASPNPDHPLKGRVAVVAAGAAIAYATTLGKNEVRLMNPLPAVVPHYLALGFALANPTDATQYCCWKIR